MDLSRVREGELPASAILHPSGSIIQAGFGLGSPGTGERRMQILPYYSLVLTLAGRAAFRDANGFTGTLTPGDTLLLLPKLANGYWALPGERWCQFWVAFSGPVFEVWRRAGVLDAKRPIRRLADADGWLVRMRAALSGRAEGPAGWSLVRCCAVQALLAEALADEGLPKEGAAWLDTARRELARSATHGQGARAAAVRLGSGWEAFRKRFRRLAGEGPERFRERAAMAEARRLLDEGRLGIDAIASQLGYCDRFHFSRRFRHQVGLPPRRWRNGLLG